MACPITVSKFVGTISLGLLTGISYATSTIAIPSLQSLPDASSASRTLKELQVRTSKHVLRLSHITAITLFTAFTLSSPRRRHPYLIWTALTALIGGVGLEWWYNRETLTWRSLSGSLGGFCRCNGSGFGVISWGSARAGASASTGGSVPVRSEEEDSNGNGSEIEIVGEEEASSPTAAAGAPATSVATPQSDDDLNVNGEAVQAEMEKERKFQRLRMWTLGLGFSMGVVGIWGDGV
ncbi:hypothetical protein RJZ56_002040 [Blastomyces dermatitidis]|uniref:Uncharacterized protein n=2 Tax=Blastomyces TaxID=229219 RepID=A0A179ULN8_BLAGS|nr:uncharacterized protein BDBG_04121 [Blastomyces gilchristii SLH14081]XP_045272547.1 uncharacterized protein BDCG_07889 [Blastomyces dermatitidis ER-3]EEQ84620.1 hypothetical protein BDCG_07889 [Blastomyces dermatitidis ER-3]EQL30162.1 hypothetical protein BDFG_07344 [Blastomyces dermatitidis ATCC 26199]OAT08139.1 hypothetical protein BDBG_04121 [Blastomyces gilchristii SLH14081]